METEFSLRETYVFQMYLKLFCYNHKVEDVICYCACMVICYCTFSFTYGIVRVDFGIRSQSGFNSPEITVCIHVYTCYFHLSLYESEGNISQKHGLQ